MAKTALGGIGGSIALPANHILKISGWQATHVNSRDDTTGFDDSGYESSIQLLTALDAVANGVALDAAAATVQGHGGGVSVGGLDLKFQTWQFMLNVGMDSTTGFVDGGYRVLEPTIVGASFVAAGTAISETEPFPVALLGNPITPANAYQAVTLTVKAGITFAGTAHIDQMQLGRVIDGKAACAVSGRFVGRITPTWVTNCPIPVALLAATADPSLAKGTIQLIVTDDVMAPQHIEFPGIVHGLTINRPEAGVCSVQYAIASRGEIAYTW